MKSAMTEKSWSMEELMDKCLATLRVYFEKGYFRYTVLTLQEEVNVCTGQVAMELGVTATHPDGTKNQTVQKVVQYLWDNYYRTG